jgi:hypothetical protein
MQRTIFQSARQVVSSAFSRRFGAQAEPQEQGPGRDIEMNADAMQAATDNHAFLAALFDRVGQVLLTCDGVVVGPYQVMLDGSVEGYDRSDYDNMEGWRIILPNDESFAVTRYRTVGTKSVFMVKDVESFYRTFLALGRSALNDA